ncbi:MAG: pentapeptide repeat-containing protein [Roseofilum sp. SBFL]|uniref:pentapeptide repeat-containing protein n=1 Tax=unclassified Roseofilum TaxID=2620099 RepID=UPI001B04CFF7|nr:MULTISPECIES: pentapeptide repeat-containing protein [unclassified Roseofilum]MBP0014032.1 pentapeptide repeat-containing protein [Roseofilum sp. SID3]MBP0023078.1 pentapeptide repeat-containing protein [Roseofilum sp. SID2]MBP0040117.1 pentapeptide repeat-containing protein [Roseofilum sp. SID1]MBP0042138.1 pentapeptide repeat-containing protein [Roseofilum sp. SBFL]
MNAREVLAKYAAGERNFQGENLRGQSFKGKNLTGADLSGADIRGTDFTGANLTGVKFCGAKTGLQKRLMALNLMIAFVISILSGFLTWWPAVFVALIFDTGNLENQVGGWISLTILVILYIVILRKGVLTGLSAGAGGVAVAGAVSGGIAVAGAVVVGGAIAGAVAGAVVGAEAVTIALAGAGGVAVAVAGAEAIELAGAGAVAGSVAGVEAVTVALAGAEAATVAIGLAGAIAVTVTGLNLYIAWRAMKGYPSDAWIRSFAVAFAAWGGTSFRRATLTDGDFTGARLKHCDFRQAHLVRTHFKNAEKLDLSRPGQTILAHTTVRNLLINPASGYKLDLCQANLRGAFLAGANLESANLKQADLSEADLSGANLKNANLTESNAIGTNFTHAYLTGACLEAWNIEPTTIFKDVDCQYIYLRDHPDPRYRGERRPHDDDETYQPGDFERIYTQLMHTVEILLRDGMNREAFATAFQRVMAENPHITWESIQSIEKKGKDVLVTVEVPLETDKAELEKTFKASYDKKLAAHKAKMKSLKRENKILERDKEKMYDLLLARSSQPFTLEMKSSLESQTMVEKQDFHAPVGSVNNQGQQTNVAGVNQGIQSNTNQERDLVEAAQEIQALLQQLQGSHPVLTTVEQMTVATEAIKTIEGNPNLKQRAINAAKGGLMEGLKQTPVGVIVAGIIEGWMKDA